MLIWASFSTQTSTLSFFINTCYSLREFLIISPCKSSLLGDYFYQSYHFITKVFDLCQRNFLNKDAFPEWQCFLKQKGTYFISRFSLNYILFCFWISALPESSVKLRPSVHWSFHSFRLRDGFFGKIASYFFLKFDVILQVTKQLVLVLNATHFISFTESFDNALNLS